MTETKIIKFNIEISGKLTAAEKNKIIKTILLAATTTNNNKTKPKKNEKN